MTCHVSLPNTGRGPPTPIDGALTRLSTLQPATPSTPPSKSLKMPAPLTLPIISIAPYFDPSLPSPSAFPSRASTAQQIHTACRDIGFFYLRLDYFPLLTPGEMDAVLREGRAFFDRPEEEKARIALGQGEGDGARGEWAEGT